MRGTLYGVSVGPGDPELLTIKAVKAIERCKTIATPMTGENKTLALDIASQAVDLEDKKIIYMKFLMIRDKQAQKETHLSLAKKISAVLDQGEDVAMLNLGDVSIYSTFAYIMDILIQQEYDVKMIPGVPSFCASAAEVKIGLTTMDKPLHIIPSDATPLDEALKMDGTKILMKSGRSIAKVKKAIKDNKLESNTYVVQNCGLPTQKVCVDIDEMSDDISYFTTVIVKK